MAFAQEWHTANQSSVSWNAVAVPEGSTIQYRVLIKNADTGGEPVEVAMVTETNHTLTLNTEGRYFVGLQSVRFVGDINVGESTINWSDDPVGMKDDATFGIQYYIPPDVPINLGLATG